MLKRPHLPADAVSQARLFHALRQPVPETERRGAFFTRATSQSPCLHETLAVAAITIRNPRSALLMAIIQKEGVHMSLKYTCPVCGTPLGYKGLCWKCRSEQERRTDCPGHRNKSQRNRKALFRTSSGWVMWRPWNSPTSGSRTG